MKIEPVITQKALSPTQIKLADHAINPYRGCEFGCIYCYGRENKNLRADRSGGLYVKTNLPEILEKELRYKNPKRVLLGSTTECFPYVEPRYRITEKILTILNKNSIPCTILTKSNVIAGYLDLIRENPRNKIYFTFNFDSDRLINIFERASPLIAARRETIKRIIAAGIDLRVHIGPYIPFLVPVEKILPLIPPEAKEIDVELYHHKMGNFPEILNQIKMNFPEGTNEKIIRVYENKQNYLEFAEELKNELIRLKQAYPFKIFYPVPEYGRFYTPNMDYDSPL